VAGRLAAVKSAEELLARLERVRQTGGERWQARCPAHDDRNPSLAVFYIAAAGKTLVHCHAGCEPADVVAEAGLPGGVAALFDDFYDRTNGGGRRGEIVDTYDYVDERDELLFQVVRFAPKDFRQRRPDGVGGWEWKLGDTRRVLYRLPRVLEAVARDEHVMVVEGEKDVHALERLGIVATCNPGGAGKWRDEYSEALRGARVVVVADRDEAGRRHARQVAESLRGVALDVDDVEFTSGKDAAEALANGGTIAELQEVEFEPEPAADRDSDLDSFALSLDEFIAARSELPAALIGEADDVLLPAAGLLILGGKGGKGKTTLVLDAVFHLASGRDWLDFRVPRPLRVLVIENEGPREMFRRKLEAKRRSWPHEIDGALFVYTLYWGALDLRDDARRRQLREYVEQNDIDLVVGDPLDSCGLEGVGSPEDTRRFMELAKDVGLHRTVAFWFLHHPRKEKTEDELDELSGAWGGRPDTVLMLSLLGGERSRLAFPKVRWGPRGKRPALILGFDADTEGFERIAEEGEERDYAAEVENLFADRKWRTLDEIRAPKDPKKGEPGIGAGRAKVEEALGDERFVSRPGREAGRHSNADVWGLASWA
jgi:5S rRNA maturation endonuclease (ribonuclease M5)